MAKLVDLDLRCDNCGALVEGAAGGAVATCAYCGARYGVEGGELTEGVAAPGKPGFWIEVNDFRGVMWLAASLYVGVILIGWLASRIPGGGVLLLSLLGLWLLGALLGRALRRPPSWVARVSAWSLGNIFPMGPVWGLLVSSGISAILFASGVTASGSPAAQRPAVAAGGPAGAVTESYPEAPRPIVMPPLDGRCATLPRAEGWFGFHPALVSPETRELALRAFPEAANHLVVVGGSVVRADPGPGGTIRLTTVAGEVPPDLPEIPIPRPVVRDSKGAIRFAVTAVGRKVAVFYTSGRRRTLTVTDLATGETGKPMTLPGLIRGEIPPPSFAVAREWFAVVWRDKSAITGVIVTDKGSVRGKLKLVEGVGGVEPRVMWTGEKWGILYGGARKGAPGGLGVHEFTSTGRKIGKNRMLCGLGAEWSASNTFTPSGAMFWRDGVYHVAGTVTPAGGGASSPRPVVLHCGPGAGAEIEACE